MEGWISLYRQIQEHWIWKSNEAFDKRSAWIDLLLIVNHKNEKVDFDGQIIDIERGQKITSLEKLSKKWKWSRHKVSDFLNRLEKERHVGTDKGQQKNAYKYCELWEISIAKIRLGHVRGHAEGTQKDSRGTQTIMIIIFIYYYLINIRAKFPEKILEKKYS